MALTPMMQQYFQVKEKYKDCIIFFRLGDFYEMFFEDAEIAARELELVLTGRDCGLENRAPMCGIPFHAANSYIARLVNKGYKIGICEQLEDPALAKGIVKRDIVKIITPGTFMDSTFLEEQKNNYIMSIYIDEGKDQCGLSFTDISTGEFYSTNFKFNLAFILDEISKFSPKEIIVPSALSQEITEAIKDKFKASFTIKDASYFISNAATLQDTFRDIVLENLDEVVLSSIQGILNYILETQRISLSNINSLEYYNVIDFMSIDINSRNNLELTESLKERSKKGSLLWVIDKTSTAMGSRLLRKWVEQPLIKKDAIESRLESVDELKNNFSLLEELREALKNIYDIERIIGKVSSKSVNAKELLTLKTSISKLPIVKNLIKDFNSLLMQKLYEDLDELKDIFELLEKSILDSPSLSIKEGNIIKAGFNEEVDELRKAKFCGKEWIASLENQEREITGIKSLKVGYNKVFGYYIEISKANYSSIPEGRYIRKQTLSNAERFITEDLKIMEDKILGAEEKLSSLEYEIFINIRNSIESHIDRMKISARTISELDCLCSLAVVALENNYVKPAINNDGYINIIDGRHPVVELTLPSGTFVSNNISINTLDEQLLLITGPNMAGKSTYMRQVALIVILAQIGSFVPATKADISICDKIFTRIGASDDLSSGKSTFMVEMWEVANILNNATNRSLVLLDEVGRGTSTYDGLSIAWAVIEYLCKTSRLKCKTLFATHYHELTKLEGIIEGVKNYSVSVKEMGKDIVFLRKIIRGGADQSYGIEVAKLAGLPISLINRAKEILADLETESQLCVTKPEIDDKKAINKKDTNTSSNIIQQINFDDMSKNMLIDEIKEIDVMSITPMEAMNKLYEIVKKAKAL